MNNELGNVLLDRERNKVPSGPSLKPPMAGQSGPMAPPAWSPPAMPQTPMEMPQAAPVEGPKVPPRMERYQTAQHMIDGYQNGWSPNPMLIRILEGG